MIDIKNLHKSFGNDEILKGIDLQVEKGKTTVIIGPSGSGKTTLLRCINLLETPSEGTISVGSSKLTFGEKNKPSKKEIITLRKKTGMVFQGFYLFPHMTVIENVIEGLVTVLKRPKNESREKGLKLLDKVGLIDKSDNYPYQLSGGQQQRVAIARAMAMEPDVLLFDEPTSALDPEIEGEVLKVMKNLSEEGMTMVIVTHKMSFARNTAHKIIFLDHGLIVEEGSPKQIFEATENQRIKQFLSLFND